MTASPPAALAAMMPALWARAVQAWPDVLLAPERFQAHLMARIADRDALPDALAKLRTDDLYLACACVHAVPEAIAAFERHFLARLPSEVTRMSRAPDFLDEIRQQLRERLLVGDPPRVAEYGGRGALGAWVRVAAVRLALNVRKESRRREQLRAPADRGGASPETLAGAAEYRAEVEAALKSALGRLGDEARQLLRLHFVDGWNLEKIAQLHRLDRSNISRRVAAARRFVLQECMRELKERVPHLTASSVQALVRDLRSDLHVTLSAAFGSGGGSGG